MPQSASSKSIHRGRLARVAILLGVVLVLLTLTWPWWAVSLVRSKIEGILHRKFDEVVIGQFQLERRALHFQKVHLQKGEMILDLDAVDVDFGLTFTGQAQIRKIEITGGSGRTTMEEVRSFLPQSDKQPSEQSRWVSTHGAEIQMQEVLVSFLHEKFAFNGLVSLHYQNHNLEGDVRDGDIWSHGHHLGKISSSLHVKKEEIGLNATLRMSTGILDEKYNVSAQEIIIDQGLPEDSGSLRILLDRIGIEGSLSKGPLTIHGVEIESASVRVSRDDRTSIETDFGPLKTQFSVQESPSILLAFDGHANTDLSTLQFGLIGEEKGKAHWNIEGATNLDFTEVVAKGTIPEIQLGIFPSLLEALPIKVSPETTVRGDFDLKLEDRVLDFNGEGALSNATIEHPVLATEPVRDVGFEGKLHLQIDLDNKRMTLPKATLARHGFIVDVLDAGMTWQSPRSLQLTVKVPETPCQTVLEAFPEDLVPGLVGFKLGGNMSAEVSVNIVESQPENTTLIGDIRFQKCKILEMPDTVSRLSGSFQHRVRRRDGVVQSLTVAHGSPNFVPLDEIAPTMTAAVISTEDGGFWKHDGFLRSQFQASLRRNVRLGKIRRGASTITMQMVKNVLLSHERTLSRKMQELFLTWVVETTLSKSRIMELYLNIVEFGPGIYGIERAARHYFGKHPMDLNGKESTFLATMLPSPVVRHEQWCRGELTPEYATKVNRLFDLIHSRKRISDEVWEMDRDTPLVFHKTGWPGKSACMAERQQFLSATGVQWAESGLLENRGHNLVDQSNEDDEGEMEEE